MKAPGVFAGTATGLVVAAMVGGMVVIGSPWTARELRLDEQRVRDLQAISAAVEQHAAAHGELPASLDDLAGPPQRIPVRLDDPVSGEPYGYEAGGPLGYGLCARFDAASEAGAAMRGDWEHPAGWHCFELEVPPATRDNP